MTTFNAGALNTIAVDAPGSIGTTIIATLPVETIWELQQNVCIGLTTETILSITQEVDLLVSLAAETILNVVQSVQYNDLVRNICPIVQRVYDPTASTMLTRNGWDATLVINGWEVPAANIHGDITITFEENQSNICSVDLLINDATTFINDVWGKEMIIDYHTATTSYRMFTGVVDIPEIDLIKHYLTLKGSNRRDDTIRNTFAPINPTIGRFSTNVFGIPTDALQEFNYRLSTITASADFDQWNNFYINSWYAKSTPDFSYTEADIYYRKPKLTWQSRTKIVNDILTTVKYQYTRLYHYQRDWSWTAPYASNLCDFLANQYSLTNIKMVEDAISAAGWHLLGNVTYESLWPNGICASGASVLVWQGLANQGSYQPMFDSTGAVVNDPSGLHKYLFNPSLSTTDLSKIYTLSATWTASTRFSQYVDENYNIQVIAPQSVAQFGDIESTNASSLSTAFDATQWEAYNYFTPQPVGIIDQNGSYFINEDLDIGQCQYDQMVWIDKSRADILGTHRDTQLEIETYLKPQLQLYHTVNFTGTPVTAQGKICKLVQKIDITEGKDNTSTITMCMFRSIGTSTDTPTAPIAQPVDGILLPSNEVVLPSQYGIAPASNTVGYIGNKNNPRVAGTLARTSIQEQFVVDTPPITDALRSQRELYSTSGVYYVNIPNDLLTVSFG